MSTLVELAREVRYPLARQLMVREQCEARYAGRPSDELVAESRRCRRVVAGLALEAYRLSQEEKLVVVDTAHWGAMLHELAVAARTGIGRG